jgi:hypothetical protein
MKTSSKCDLKPCIETYFFNLLLNLHSESAKQFADLPCLGTRNSDGPFEWETYAEVLRRVTNLGSGLVELGLEPVCI